MSFTIKDGRGTGKEAAVTSDKRLSTSAITETESVLASSNGTRFNINTGTITLTSAANTSLIYIANNEDNDLILQSVIYLFGNSTGGSGDATIDVIRNPLTGGIITNANAVDINANYNFGSNRNLNALTYKGATGETLLSGGTTLLSTLLSNASGRVFISLDSIVLTKGSSVGVNYTPPTGNTSQGVQIAFAAYVKTFEI